ncbi:MAG: GNAT family N-acetyltransferase [Cytophagales bacterium]|nr:GNAT family N-acetyltransferase [Cytophagales bacterium]
MPVQIFEATTHHAQAITQLLMQMGHPGELESVTDRITANQLPGYKIFVAAVNQKIAGVLVTHTYTYLHAAGLFGRIMTFCVDEAVRGTGVGTQLLTHAEKYLASEGCVKVELNCNNRRLETHQYYKNRGYDQTSLHFVKKLL